MENYQNILIVRTDRIGDVVLTTPSIVALRRAYPRARVSLLIAPQTYDIVDGNPYVDEVIIDDRNGEHKGFWGFMKLIRVLRRKKFDLAVIFHTKKHTNLACFLAGIPQRIGYRNEKLGFLLTKGIKDARSQGTKHEAEYCLDVLRFMGIDTDIADSAKIVLPVKREPEEWAQKFLDQNKIRLTDRLVAVHAGASCISRRWSPGNFAEVIKGLRTKHAVKIILIGSGETESISKNIAAMTGSPVLDVTGRISISQLIGLLKKCCLLISNDSGPVHLAVGVGTPVISIFSRNQKGINPERWKPLGRRDIVLHKDVGCKICRAHKCTIDFQCLKAISVNDVLAAADSLL